MRLENKVAVVTGAGRGIGRAIATRLAEEGAKVVVSDIDSAASQSEKVYCVHAIFVGMTWNTWLRATRTHKP